MKRQSNLNGINVTNNGTINVTIDNSKSTDAIDHSTDRLVDNKETKFCDLMKVLCSKSGIAEHEVKEQSIKEQEKRIAELETIIEKKTRDEWETDIESVQEELEGLLSREKRRPGVRQLRKNYHRIALIEGQDESLPDKKREKLFDKTDVIKKHIKYRCEVFENGYAAYDNGNRKTVFWVGDCWNSKYTFTKLTNKEKARTDMTDHEEVQRDETDEIQEGKYSLIGLSISIIVIAVSGFAAIQGCVEDRDIKRTVTIIICGLVAIAIILTITQYYASKENDNEAFLEDSQSDEAIVSDGEDEIHDDIDIIEEESNVKQAVDLESIEDQPEDPLIQEEPYVRLNDMFRIEESNVHIDASAVTTRGETWLNSMRLGSSNLNSDGISYLSLPCNGEYSRFTAEIAPQEGFDGGETVTLTIYGQDKDDNYVELGGTYEIGLYTKTISVDLDISSCDLLIIYKDGEYNTARIAGQYLNGYTGMGVLIKDGKLYRK